ncbi:hypothetical protein FRC19_002495 [Serendipita sp. 401]|nr:hypothetical protein FRC19_002495 [Serendipita sp. 401]
MHPLRPAVFPIRDSPSPELRMVRAGYGGPNTSSMSTSTTTSPSHYSHQIAHQRLLHESVNGIGGGLSTATATIAINGGNGNSGGAGAGGSANGGLGVHRTRRPRRRADEVERLYKCTWNGCEKSYGTLSHLNDHVRLQRHGNKREPHEFKEARRIWRQERKSRRLREHAIHAAQAAQQAASNAHHHSHPRMHTLSSSSSGGGGMGSAPASHGAHPGPRQLLDERRNRPYSSSGATTSIERVIREDISRRPSSSYDTGYQQRAYPPPPHRQQSQQPPGGEQQITEQPQSRLVHQAHQRHHHQLQHESSSGESQRRQVAEWTQSNSRFGSALEYEEALRRRRAAARGSHSGPGSPEAVSLSLPRDSAAIELIGSSAASARSSLRPQSQNQSRSSSALGLRDIREPEQQAESGDQLLLQQQQQLQRGGGGSGNSGGESRLGLALGHPRYHQSLSGGDYPHSRRIVVASSSPNPNSNSNSSGGGGGTGAGGSLLFSRDNNRPYSPSPVPSPFLGPSSGSGGGSLPTSNTLAPPPPAHGVRTRAATVSTLTSLSSDSDSILRMQQHLHSQTHSPSPSERKYGKEEDDTEMARLMGLRRMAMGDGDGKYWDRDRDGDEILIKRSPSPTGSVIRKGDSASLRLPSIAELRLDLSLDEYEAETTLGSLSTAGTMKKAGQQLHSYGIGGASASAITRDSSALASAGTVTPTAIRPSSATPTTVDYYQHNQAARAVRNRHRDSWESPSPRLGDGSRASSAQASSHAFPQQKQQQSSHSHSLIPPPPYHVYQQQQLQAQAQQGRPQNQSLTPTMLANELESPRSTGAQHLSSPDYTSNYRFRIAPPPPPSSSMATMTTTPSSSGMSLSSATTSPSIDSQHLRGTLPPPPPPPPSSYPSSHHHHGLHHLPRSRTSSHSGGRRLSTSRPSTSTSTTSSTTTSSTTAHHTIQYPFIQASLPRVHSTPDVRAGSSSGGDGKGGVGSVMISATPGVVSGEPRRKRRKYEEIERRYQCGWNGCTKAYGTLNHLNDHVSLQNHGPKRRSSGEFLDSFL